MESLRKKFRARRGKERGYHNSGVFSTSLIQEKWKVRRHWAIWRCLTLFMLGWAEWLVGFFKDFYNLRFRWVGCNSGTQITLQLTIQKLLTKWVCLLLQIVNTQSLTQAALINIEYKVHQWVTFFTLFFR